MPRHAGNIYRGRRRLETRVKIPQGKLRFPVLADHDRGDPLARDGGGIEVLQQAAVAMAVHVDETGRQREPAFIEYRIARQRLQVRRYRRNPSAVDANVGGR